MICKTKIKNQIRYKHDTSEGSGVGERHEPINLELIPFDVKLSFLNTTVGLLADSVGLVKIPHPDFWRNQEPNYYDHTKLVEAADNLIEKQDQTQAISDYYFLLKGLKIRGMSTSTLSESGDRVNIPPDAAAKAMRNYEEVNKEVAPTALNLKLSLQNIRKGFKDSLGNILTKFQKPPSVETPLENTDIQQNGSVEPDSILESNHWFDEDVKGKNPFASEEKEKVLRQTRLKEEEDKKKFMTWKLDDNFNNPISGYTLAAVADLHNFGVMTPNAFIKVANSLKSRVEKFRGKESKIPDILHLRELRIQSQEYLTEDGVINLHNVNNAMTKLFMVAGGNMGKLSLFANLLMPYVFLPVVKAVGAYDEGMEKVGQLTSQRMGSMERENVVNAFNGTVNNKVGRAVGGLLYDSRESIETTLKEPFDLNESMMGVSEFTGNVMRSIVDPRVVLGSIGRGFLTPQQVEAKNAKTNFLNNNPLTPREKKEAEGHRKTADMNTLRAAEGKSPVVWYSIGQELDSLSESKSEAKKMEYVNMLLEFAKQNGIEIEIDTTLQPTTGITLEQLRGNQINTAIMKIADSDLEVYQNLINLVISQTPESVKLQESNFENFMRKQKPDQRSNLR